MDKLGVEERMDDEVMEKAANEGCPICGSKVYRMGQLMSCPKCGTEPFEKTKVDVHD